MAAGMNVCEGNSEFVRTGSLRAKMPTDDAFQRGSIVRRTYGGSSSTPEWNGRMSSSHTPSSSDVAENGMPDSPRKLKDKSLKRKSNLNRAMFVDTNSAAPALLASSLPDDSLQRWRRAKKLESPPNTILSDGNGDSVVRRSGRVLKRPEIPEVLRRQSPVPSSPGSSAVSAVTVNRLSYEDTIEPCPPSPLSQVPCTSSPIPCSQPSSYTVRFHVRETANRSPVDEAVDRVQELTQLVRATTAKVDTLTNAALNSDLMTTSDSDVTETMKTKTLTTITATPPPEDTKIVINVTAKPPSTPAAHHSAGPHVSRIRLKAPECQIDTEKDKKSPVASSEEEEEEEDEDELTMTRIKQIDINPQRIHQLESTTSTTSSSKKPTSILKRPSIDDGGTGIGIGIGGANITTSSVDEEPTSILRRRNSSGEAAKTHSILKMPPTHEADEPHHGILKRRSSVEGMEPRPILKKRSSIEESDRPKPILKTQRTSRDEDTSGNSSGGGGGGGSGGGSGKNTDEHEDLKPILKKQHRSEEPPTSILKNYGEGRRLLKTRSEDLVRESEGSEKDEGNKVDSTVGLLPSALKKKSKEMHPLATPFSEFANIIRERNPQDTQSTTPKPKPVMIDLDEQAAAHSDGERRMSVADRILQMETKLAADEGERRRSGYSTPRLASFSSSSFQETSICSSQLASRLETISGERIVQRRIRERNRFHTQPITMEEVVESKNFNAVEKLKKAIMTRQNEEIKHMTNGVCKEDEMKAFGGGRSLQRSRTQPLTASELQKADRKEMTTSDSDEDPSKMSLAERVKLFDRKVFEERFNALRNSTATLAENDQHPEISTSTSTSYVRRTSSRFQTQPITLAEVEKAHQQNVNAISKDKIDIDDDDDEVVIAHGPPKVHPPTPYERATIIPSSSNDEDSSGPGIREGRRIIKNEAINRRRNAALRRKDERRSMCELYEYHQQNVEMTPTTALLMQNEMEDERNACKTNSEGTMMMTTTTAAATTMSQVSSSQSISERLAALKKHGEEWKERRTRGSNNNNNNNNDSDEQKKDGPFKSLAEIRERRRSRDERPSSIVDRISQLAESQQGWKQRVEEKDNAQFTVAGRMGCVEQDVLSPSTPDRVRFVPKRTIFKSETTADFQQLHARMDKERMLMASPVQRSASSPMCNLLKMEENNISVPKADDETFEAFFHSISNVKQDQTIEISDEGFQKVLSESRQLLVQKRDIARQKRTTAASKNPVKALASRTDLQNEYTEVKTGFAEREMKRIQTEKIAQSSSLSVSALAGLASKEDFTAIPLRKCSSNVTGPLLPFKDLMLLQIKGRRHVQTRLVKPSVDSINRGDNFILVTPREVYNWIGRFSNVIERSKGSDVVMSIQTKRDLGLAANAEVMIIDEEKGTETLEEKRFLELLNGDATQIQEAGNPKEDEDYENAVIDTNMAYEVDAERLVPHPDCWGTVPKIDILDSHKVLVFDFGSEMYVWQGKLAPTALRRMGVHLAQQLWDQGYNYSECIINPLYPVLSVDVMKTDNKRPAWSLFAKVNQHMETILFKEKFLDWPDAQRLIKIKSPERKERTERDSETMMPCNTKEMIDSPITEPDLVLESSHLGRGKSFSDTDSRRHYEITTLGIKVWHVVEKGYKLLPRESWGHFHSGDTYVVRWQYTVTVTGRDLSGQMSRHSFVGRERCAYFFWQGSQSTVNDKGASALMTVELDEERGPHVRVLEDHEHPCFLSLFDGTMIVHKGKRKSMLEDEENGEREDSKIKEQVRLFILRTKVESEACLREVEASRSSLRSRASLILVDPLKGSIFVWHGVKSSSDMRQVAVITAENIQHRRPVEFGFECHVPLDLEEIEEGNEPSTFFETLHGKGSYYTLLSSSLLFDYTPRLFHLSSISGAFSAVEVLCAFRSSSFSVPFPFVQSDLYDCDQPALFLLDNNDEVFLWQGWWVEANDDNDNVSTGSAKVRWNVDRRCAMETAIKYCSDKNSNDPPPAYLVSAGLEPLRFTNLFPYWDMREDVAELNSRDGKKAHECPLVCDVLPRISRTRYTLNELQSQPLPENVDPSRIESYLDDVDFEETLGVSREEFYALPAWKQNDMKKSSGLF